MSDKLQLRPYQHGDRDQLLRLKCDVFRDLVFDNELRRWIWELEDNPFRAEHIPTALVVQAPDQIAGYFAFVPYRIQMGAQTVAGCTGIDLSMRKEYRGEKASHWLVQGWMDPEFCAFPFATALGPAATHLLKAAGGECLGGRLETIAYAYFVEEHHPSPREHADPVEEIEEFGPDADTLWERLRRDHRLILVKDSLYLNWRYRDFPFEKPTLLRARAEDGSTSGLAVVQVDREFQRVYLCDLLALPHAGSAARGLLRAAVQVAVASGEKILYFSTRDERQVPAVLAEGYRPVPGDVPTFMAKINFTPEDGPLKVTDWHTSLGDGDQLYNVGEPKAS